MSFIHQTTGEQSHASVIQMIELELDQDDGHVFTARRMRTQFQSLRKNTTKQMGIQRDAFNRSNALFINLMASPRGPLQPEPSGPPPPH
jgi:hypothetical protein